MTYSLRWQRWVVIAGFLAVAIGWIGYIALVWGVRSPSRAQEHSDMVFGIGSVVGYAVFAGASWCWFKWIESSPVLLAGMARVLRHFAVGNLFLALGLAAVSYYWANQAVTQPYDGRTTMVAAASNGFGFFGFLLAAFAFWGASSEVHSVGTGLSSPRGSWSRLSNEIAPMLRLVTPTETYGATPG
jgi:hypothetical protein